MDTLTRLFEILADNYRSDVISPGSILSMLVMVTLLSFYLYFVYRVVSRRTFYNHAFHTTIMVIPYFVGAIIMCLQTNAVVTLGTIGALAIIRFRTAVKDPVDMIYILWSVFIGITCGCRLYETCVLTSLTVTVILLCVNLLSGIIKSPYCLVIHTDRNCEKECKDIVEKHTKKYRIKSRNFTSKGVDYVFEVNVKDIDKLIEELDGCESVSKFSLIEYDTEDIM